jgi:putative tricarboxylic transport membrane protein
VAAATGLFAFAEVGIRASIRGSERRIAARLTSIIPTRQDLKVIVMPILRGTALGSAFGVLPGTGPLISSFAAYAVEKQVSPRPERFGNGAIEGVAAPEAANNAAAITHFIPMLALGIPAGAANALMLGALTMQGITPGPEIISKHAELFWGIVASMWIGNLMLLVLNLPMVGIWIRLLMIPYRLLYPTVLVFCCIGVYSVNNQVNDLYIAALFGVIGFVFRKLDCPPGPLILGLVLGPSLEEHFRRALLLSRGDPSVFFTSPISVAMMLLTLAYVIAFRYRARTMVMAEKIAE